MRRNVIILSTATLLFSFFFYEQRAGINFALFSLALVLMLFFDNMKRIRDTRWVLFAFLSLLTGFFVAWHGTGTSIAANIVALSVLACHSVIPKTSFFPAAIMSFYSYISSFVYLIVDLAEPKGPREKPVAKTEKSRIEPGAKIVIAIVGFAILVVFMALYRNANPVFKEFTDDINLDFVSVKWMGVTLLGFLLMYGFFFIRYSESLYKKDSEAPSALNSEENSSAESSLLGFKMHIHSEALIVTIFLALLNLMLLLLNVLDISFMANGGNLPTDITYADYLHKGVATLIISVIFVIFIVMYFFRGALNFYEKSSTVRLLALIWLVQNLIMLGSTAFRNAIYIDEFSLTYSRIGVYVWLILTCFGLITTIFKVYAKLAAWFLIRSNGWAFFAVILLLGTVNWDLFIAKYNARNSDPIDFEYLSKLNSNTLPIMYEVLDVQKTSPASLSNWDDIFRMFDGNAAMNNLSDRTARFNTRFEEASWKSWNYDDWVTYNNLP